MNNYMVSYDISDDGLRTHLVKLLERNGLFRVQKSVFVAPNYSVKNIRFLKGEVVKLMQLRGTVDADSVLCVPLSEGQLAELWWKVPKPLPDFERDIVLWF